MARNAPPLSDFTPPPPPQPGKVPMRVVCDNCAATYNIPEHKLTKEVNKATCRKCGHRMLIRRPSSGRVLPPSEEKTQTMRAPLRASCSTMFGRG